MAGEESLEDQEVGPEGEEQASQEEVEETDVADEEDLDLEIEQVTPKKKSGCGPVGWIVLIIILGVIAVLGYNKWNAYREDQLEKERQERQNTYQTNEAGIKQDVDAAASLAAKGDIDAATEKLKGAEEKWGAIASTANSANDAAPAKRAATQKGKLKEVIDKCNAVRADAQELQEEAGKLHKKIGELQKQIDDVEAKRDALNERIRKMIMQLRPGAGDTDASPAEPEAG